MATLTNTITDADIHLAVTGDVSAAASGGYYRIDDEAIQIVTFERSPVPTSQGHRQDQDRARWLVRRSQLGTAGAAHTSGAAIVSVIDAAVAGIGIPLPSPFAGSGSGGVTATDGTTTVAATTLNLTPGSVSDAGGGTADINTMPPPWTVDEHGTLTIQPDDTNADCLVLKDHAGNVIAKFAQVGLGSPPYPGLFVDSGGDIVVSVAETGQGFAILRTDGTPLMNASSDGRLFIGPPPGGAGGLVVTAPDTDPPYDLLAISSKGKGDLSVGSADATVAVYKNTGQTGPMLLITDSAFAPVFRVDADGSVHIKTGTSIVADL